MVHAPRLGDARVDVPQACAGISPVHSPHRLARSIDSATREKHAAPPRHSWVNHRCPQRRARRPRVFSGIRWDRIFARGSAARGCAARGTRTWGAAHVRAAGRCVALARLGGPWLCGNSASHCPLPLDALNKLSVRCKCIFCVFVLLCFWWRNWGGLVVFFVRLYFCWGNWGCFPGETGAAAPIYAQVMQKGSSTGSQ